MKNESKLIVILALFISGTCAADVLGWVARRVTGNYAYVCGRNLSSTEKRNMKIDDNHEPQSHVFAAPDAKAAARNCRAGDLYKVRSNGALSKK